MILKVDKDAAVAALLELIASGEEILKRDQSKFYDDALPRTSYIHPSLESSVLRRYAEATRKLTATWCERAQRVVTDSFVGFSLSDSLFIGDNKMFPRVSVLKEILLKIEKSALTLGSANVTAAHHEISGRCGRNFMAGHYDDAVFDAFKALENGVRSRIGAPLDKVGADLVKEAMNPTTPKLVFSPVPSEQESVYLLFRGAIGFLKNPLSHRFQLPLDEQTAAEAVAFASLLMRLVDSAVIQV